jgi:hypothetical protein
MDTSEYEIEHGNSMAGEYNDEVLCAGWNPSIALQHYTYAEKNWPAAMPHELASIDAELFLKEMYAYQR